MTTVRDLIELVWETLRQGWEVRREARRRVPCGLPGTPNGYVYGGWKSENSGVVSYNSCGWPWQTTAEGIIIQKRTR